MAGRMPSFQFYPGDWRKDPALRACAPASRGIWIDTMCLMFDCALRGVLITGDCVWSEKDWANAIGGNGDVTAGCIRELIAKGVVRQRGKESEQFRTENAELLAGIPDGAFYSWRMVRDQHERDLVRNRVNKFRNEDKGISQSSTESHSTMSQAINNGSNGVCNGDVTLLKRRSSSASSTSSSSTQIKGGISMRPQGDASATPPLFEPVKRGLFRREYQEMLKDAKAQVKRIKVDLGNYDMKLSQSAQDLVEFIRSKAEPDAEARIEELKRDPKNLVRGEMKAPAKALLEAWEGRVKEIENAMNGILADVPQGGGTR